VVRTGVRRLDFAVFRVDLYSDVNISEGASIPPAAVAAAEPDAERRFAGSDRRRRPTPALSRYTFFGGRRRGGRRPGENEASFVDLHGPGLLAVVLGIVALNFLDAWFTMFFLSHGGEELNPIMDAVIREGTLAFVLLKSLGIGICVAVLTIAKNFRFARVGLGFVLVGYAALFGWHMYLYAHMD
jgi:hypothetical protein